MLIHQALTALALLLFFLTTTVVAAAPSKASSPKASYPKTIAFQHPMEGKDVSVGVVEDLLQDRDGFLWIGGRHGVVRYDGYEYHPVLAFSPGQPSATPLSNITDFFQDSQGRIWVGSRDGLFLYNEKKGYLSPFEHDGQQTTAGLHDDIHRILEAPDGRLLIATLVGLYIFSPETFTTEHIGQGAVSQGLLKDQRIRDFAFAPDGRLWIGTDGGLSHYDLSTQRMAHYMPAPENPASVEDNAIRAVVIDHEGIPWLGMRNAFARFDPISERFVRYTHDPDQPESIGDTLIWELYLDSRGFLWIGTDKGGLSLFDPDKERFFNFTHHASQRYSLTANSVRSILEDNSGDLWIGTYPEGLNYFSWASTAIQLQEHQPHQQKSLSHSSVMAIQQDRHKNLWLGTDGGGLNYYDKTHERFTHLKHDSKDPNSLSSNSVLCVYQDGQQALWIGTWGGGFNHYSPSTQTFTRFSTDNSQKPPGKSQSTTLSGKNVWAITEDNRGRLWLGTHMGGVSVYDRASKTFTHYQNDPSDASSLLSNTVWAIHQDRRNRIWIGTVAGIDLFDPHTETFTHFRHDELKEPNPNINRIFSIFEDSLGQMWFGTDGGLKRFNEKTQDFTLLTEQDGLSANVVHSIVEDDLQRLWIGTSNGLTLFDPNKNKMKTYTVYNGKKIGSMNSRAALMSRSGHLLMGSSKGLWEFQIDKMGDNPVVPPLVLTDFRLFTESVQVDGQDGLLAQAINHTSSITLDYHQNMFSLRFSSLNYNESAKNQYAYKLEGFDDVWREIGYLRTATFTNLGPGQYTLKVRGSNNDGIWNETGRALTIIQLPPPWRTWWAYTIYTLVIVGSIWRAFDLQRRKRKQAEEQNRILEIKVAERTAELRQKNHDIQSMLSHMEQGLLTICSEGTIHPEYSDYLTSIVQTEAIAGQPAIEVLFGHAQIGTNERDQIATAMDAIVGFDDINFDLNEHLLPREMQLIFADKTKDIELSWNPIDIDGNTDKLMVTIRDVTLLKQMEKDSREQQRELDIIGQLIALPHHKFLSFERTAERFLQENREKIEKATDYRPTTIELLFRNMHTLKGNCRTYGFSFLSDVVHEAETAYSQLKASDGQHWDTAVLLKDLTRVEQKLDTYKDIFHRVLRQEEDASTSKSGVWVETSALGRLRQLIHGMVGETPPSLASIAPIKAIADDMASVPFATAVEDIVQSLPSIARQLGKVEPTITIDPNIRVPHEATELMNGVFAHVLRNSLDHGIETPDVREQKNKAPQGTITIGFRHDEKQHRLDIVVRDDGQGMNMDRLRAKGHELNRWQTGEDVPLEQVAALIFASGVSTKEQVTDISGRGVGMDAVKEFLQERGADIHLGLLADKPDDKGFMPFETVITLPQALFVMLTPTDT